MGKYSSRITAITQEEGELELWSFTIDGMGVHAMYLPQQTTIEIAAEKMLRVAIKGQKDTRIGKYKLIEGGAPQKIKANDGLEEDFHKLEDRVKKLEKLWLTSG